MQDRIEVSGITYNVYTNQIRDGEKLVTVIFKENKNHCDILSSYRIKINNPGDINMRLTSLHNNMLTRLFKALRKNKENPEIEFDEAQDIDRDDKIMGNDSDSSGYEKKAELEEEVFRFWDEYCSENLPEVFDTCLISDGKNSKVFSREEISENKTKTIKSINDYIRNNRQKINTVLGTPKEVIAYDDECNYFYFPLSENVSIISTSKAGPIGIQLKALEKFKNGLLEEL